MALTDTKNINLDLDTRQRFSINGDATKIITLDPKDLNIVSRMSGAVTKINALQKDWDELAIKSKKIEGMDNVDDVISEVSEFSEQFNSLEREMRHVIDEIFNSEGLCDTVLEDTSIFSLKDGKFKYNIIIDTFSNLYEDAIKQEVNKIDRTKVATKTSKYIRNK